MQPPWTAACSVQSSADMGTALAVQGKQKPAELRFCRRNTETKSKGEEAFGINHNAIQFNELIVLWGIRLSLWNTLYPNENN